MYIIYFIYHIQCMVTHSIQISACAFIMFGIGRKRIQKMKQESMKEIWNMKETEYWCAFMLQCVLYVVTVENEQKSDVPNLQMCQ